MSWYQALLALMTDKMSEGSGRACAFVQSRQGLAAHYHNRLRYFVWSLQKSNTLPYMQMDCNLVSRIRSNQAACDTGDTAILVLFLEHSLDPSIKLTYTEPHMSWYLAQQM